MIIVKITILLVMVTALYIWLWRAWLESNPIEAFKIISGRITKSGLPAIILVILDAIGIFTSVIWALFFR